MTKLKDITVFDKLYDPHADGYMIAGKLKDSTSTKPYILGWHTRRGRRLIEPRQYKNKGWLTRSFLKAAQYDTWPDAPAFKTDKQEQQLYAWEYKYLEPHTVKINEQQARDIVRRVCTDYDIAPITFHWRPKSDEYSCYLHTDHSIQFCHRDLVSLLHEIGHAIHMQNPRHTKGPHHSPAYARLVMDLYHRYAGFETGYLMVSANQCGLLGDIKSKQIIFKPEEHRTP